MRSGSWGKRTFVACISVRLCLVPLLFICYFFYLISTGLKLDNESPLVAVNYVFIVGVVCMDRKFSPNWKGQADKPGVCLVELLLMRDAGAVMYY